MLGNFMRDNEFMTPEVIMTNNIIRVVEYMMFVTDNEGQLSSHDKEIVNCFIEKLKNQNKIIESWFFDNADQGGDVGYDDVKKLMELI